MANFSATGFVLSVNEREFNAICEAGAVLVDACRAIDLCADSDEEIVIEGVLTGLRFSRNDIEIMRYGLQHLAKELNNPKSEAKFNIIE